MTIAVLGTGRIATTLAVMFAEAGHAVRLGSSDARHGRLEVVGAGTRQQGDHVEGLFEFFAEDVEIVAMRAPPRLLACDVLLCCCCEPNPSLLQRDLSSRKTASASTTRPRRIAGRPGRRVRRRTSGG